MVAVADVDALVVRRVLEQAVQVLSGHDSRSRESRSPEELWNTSGPAVEHGLGEGHALAEDDSLHPDPVERGEVGLGEDDGAGVCRAVFLLSRVRLSGRAVM